MPLLRGSYEARADNRAHTGNHLNAGGTELVRDPYWHDKTHALYAGDPRQVLAELPPGSADCIVTSPPAWTPPHPDVAGDAPKRYGLEPTPALYIAALRRVFAQAHRVLADAGTAWLITGDRYAGQTGWDGPPTGRHRRTIRDKTMTGVPATSLIGLPWQLAFALQDDGWIIRNAIVWHHPSTEEQPEADRLALSYELIFLLVKTDQYYFNHDATRHPPNRLISELRRHNNPVVEPGRQERRCGWHHMRRQSSHHGIGKSGKRISDCRIPPGTEATQPSSRHNPAALPLGPAEDVWTLPAPTQRPALPIEVPLTCVAVGCRPGGTVLDMFTGSATTGIAARKLGRSYIGVEQSWVLCRVAEQNLRDNGGHSDGDLQ
ncbi:site-specific DNA-methyltransferase [Actinomadura miaoliensis]|uniref:Methyltransferase n=1 Tax=Actinomadura miaoliensis TaxID=430685 RepID=A0ABP7WZS4_9ACTN